MISYYVQIQDTYQKTRLIMDITLDKITKEDIPSLVQFPPKSWGFNLAAFAEENFQNRSVHFITAKYRRELIGIGNIIINGSVGWIGNMIVVKQYQRQGIGTRIFGRLKEIGEQNRVKKYVLIASDEGFPLYMKEGFIPVGYYNFYSKPDSLSDTQTRAVKILPEEMNEVWKLDKKITGEDRRLFLSRYASGAWGLNNGEGLKGVYYPGYGTGSVLALDEASGLELLLFRLQNNDLTTVIPEDNRIANRFMKTQGSEITMQVMRMERPVSPKWNPNMIFSRGTGYAG